MGHVIAPEEKSMDLKYMLGFGKHKSASTLEGESTIDTSYSKEVDYGWQIPIPLKKSTYFKHARVIPIRVATQSAFRKEGEKIPKCRVTYDGS